MTCLKCCCCSAGLEEVQDAHLHRGPDGRQQHPDEKGPDHFPLSSPHRRYGGSCRNGEFFQGLIGFFKRCSNNYKHIFAIHEHNMDKSTEPPAHYAYRTCSALEAQHTVSVLGSRREEISQIGILLQVPHLNSISSL